MKSFLNGLKKVFGFTVRHRLTKGWKTATLTVMLCAPARNYVFLGIHSKK